MLLIGLSDFAQTCNAWVWHQAEGQPNGDPIKVVDTTAIADHLSTIENRHVQVFLGLFQRHQRCFRRMLVRVHQRHAGLRARERPGLLNAHRLPAMRKINT